MRNLRTTVKIRVVDLVSGEYVPPSEGSPAFVRTRIGDVRSVRVLGTVVDRYEREDERGFASLTVHDGSGVVRVKVWDENVSLLKDFKKNDIVDIIGRVSYWEARGEIFIVPELIIPVEDFNWELLRRLEIIDYYKSLGVSLELPLIPVLEKPLEKEKTKDLREKKEEELFPEDIVPEIFDEEVGEGFSKELLKWAEKELEEKDEEEISEEVLRRKRLEEQKGKVVVLIEKLDEGEGVPFEQIQSMIQIEEDDLWDVLQELLEEGTIFERRPTTYSIVGM
ncbi:MAG: OB-fold nucleic acid binding domain-containing protein [Candidatus Wukongarchaeota archaeon]|nr:OB-fold nucleic acid binding domain-containing protein [Candidatus Wukongarchaeota archaeon]